MASTTPKIIPEKILIDSIRVLGGSIEALENANSKNKVGYDVSYDVTSDLLLEEKLHRFIIGIQIEALDGDESPIGIKGSYKIEYIFKIENQEDFIEEVDETNKKVLLHPILPNTLASIVYSTSRGIILTRTQGTLLEEVILPVINPNSLVSQISERTSE